MDIPREFNKLTHAQLVYFARAGFDVYWDFVDSLMKGKELNSTIQHISKDVAEMQKIINKQNQKINENN